MVPLDLTRNKRSVMDNQAPTLKVSSEAMNGKKNTKTTNMKSLHMFVSRQIVSFLSLLFCLLFYIAYMLKQFQKKLYMYLLL